MKTPRPFLIVLGILFLFLVASCVTTSGPPQKIELVVRAVDKPVEVTKEPDVIHRSMEIQNQEAGLSNLTSICGDEIFIKIWSIITTIDAVSLWNDICVLEKTSDLRNIRLLIYSGGGDAFAGLGLADFLRNAQSKGFYIKAYAAGIVASAAVPVFAVCDERIAMAGTLFMIHEASIWKWPGTESASDIRAQGKMMGELNDRYIKNLTNNSKLSKEEWEGLQEKITWFSAEKAKEYGLVDRIE